MINTSDFKDALTGIEYLKETFSLQVTEGAKPYQVPPTPMACALHKTFKAN